MRALSTFALRCFRRALSATTVDRGCLTFESGRVNYEETDNLYTSPERSAKVKKTGSRRVVKCEPKERKPKKKEGREKIQKNKVTIFPRVRQSLFLCTASAPMEFGGPVIPCNFVQLLEPRAHSMYISALSGHAPTPKSNTATARELSFFSGAFCAARITHEPSPVTDYGRLRKAASTAPCIKCTYVRGRNRSRGRNF